MKIKLNTKAPMIYDFLRAICSRHNGVVLKEKLEAGGFKASRRLGDIESFIWEDLDVNVPGVALFFYQSKENQCYMYKVFDPFFHKLEDINALIADAFEGPVEKLQSAIIKHYDSQPKEASFYKSLMKDDTGLYEYINNFNVPVRVRWELYGFLRKPEDILEPLKEFCHRAKRKIKNVYKTYGEDIKSFNKETNVKIKNHSELWFNTELNKVFSYDLLEKDKDITITYSLLVENLTRYNERNDEIVITLGIEYEQILKSGKFRSRADINDAFLKVFSDKHRMRIFRSLLNQEMYVGQIAKTHKMILSTTSYHLDLLLGVNAIIARPEGKRIYYSVNKDFVSGQLSEIAELVKEGKF